MVPMDWGWMQSRRMHMVMEGLVAVVDGSVEVDMAKGQGQRDHGE